MLSKARLATVLAILLTALLAVSTAQAIPLTGSFSKSGSLIPVLGDTGTITGLATATGLDFTSILAPDTPSPAVAGEFVVGATSGSFSTLLTSGAMGTIEDFSFSGPGSASFPGVPIASFESVSGVTFDLNTISIVSQVAIAPGIAFLVLSGTGTFHAAGFDATPGLFLFTAQQAGTAVSWSSSQIAQVVPEPASLSLLSLLGLGLAALGLLGRRHRKG